MCTDRHILVLELGPSSAPGSCIQPADFAVCCVPWFAVCRSSAYGLCSRAVLAQQGHSTHSVPHPDSSHADVSSAGYCLCFSGSSVCHQPAAGVSLWCPLELAAGNHKVRWSHSLEDTPAHIWRVYTSVMQLGCRVVGVVKDSTLTQVVHTVCVCCAAVICLGSSTLQQTTQLCR